MKRILALVVILVTALSIYAQKKVVIVSSSPRKDGNTEQLCKEFMRGAKEAGNTVEMIRLNDYKINFIDEAEVDSGMHGVRSLSKRDDAAMILEKMDSADVIVLASPVYFMNITGQMKTLMDRTFSTNVGMSSKEYYYITACTDNSESTADCAIRGFDGYTMCLPGSEVKGMIKAYGCQDRGSAGKYMDAAYKLGKSVK